MDTEKRIAARFLASHPQDAARLCEALPPNDVAAFFLELPVSTVAPVLQYLAPTAAADCLPLLPANRVGGILALLPLDSAAGILRRMSESDRARFLGAVPESRAHDLSLVLRYPAHSAGALMDPTVLSLPNDIEANEARHFTRRSARRILYYLYVVDREQKLVGVLNLRELILANPHDPLTAVMHAPVVHLTARVDTAAILNHPGWHRWHSLPVVDDHNVFLGAVRYQTLRRLQDESSTALRLSSALDVAMSLGEMYWITAGKFLGTLGLADAPAHPGVRPSGRSASHSERQYLSPGSDAPPNGRKTNGAPRDANG
jgi:magnesium transporter